MRYWDFEIENKIMTLKSQHPDMKQREIAEVVGLTQGSVSKYLRRNNIEGYSGARLEVRIDRELEARIRVLYEQGLEQKEIALRLGMPNQPMVHRYLRRMGLTGFNYNWLKELTEEQHQILVGTMLGDGHLQLGKGKKQACLSMGHCDAQAEWMRWKRDKLGVLFRDSWSRYKTKDTGVWCVSTSSRSHPILTEYHKLFYSRPDAEMTEHIHRKMVTPEILERANNPLSIAVWFGDDGSKDKGSKNQHPRISLALGAMTEREYVMIKEWFDPTGSVSTFSDTDSNCKVLRFKKDFSIRLAACLRPQLHKSMQYKLDGV